MWVPLVVAGFESVVVVWVLVGLLNRWWLWVVKSVWDGFESLVFGSSNFSLFVGFGWFWNLSMFNLGLDALLRLGMDGFGFWFG